MRMKNIRLSHMRCLVAGLSLALCALYFAACDNLVGRMEWATYTIVYHANDGTGRTRISDSIRHGDPHYIKENMEGQVFVHGGHAFESWRMLRDGSYFEGGESVERLATRIGETIDLHAIWRPNTFRIRFNANGGSGEMKDGRVFTFGEPGQFLLRNVFGPPRAESFLGWAKSPAPGSPILIPAEEDGGPLDHRLVPEYDGAYIILYAVWHPEGTVFTLTFDANDGFGTGPSALEVDAGATAILPNQQGLTKPGHVFVGWNTMADGSGETFAAGGSFLPQGDVTLYAMWRLDLTEGGEGGFTVVLPPNFQDMAPVIANKTLSLLGLQTTPASITIAPPQGGQFDSEGARWIFGGIPITATTGENGETFVYDNGATIVFGPRIHGELLGVSGEHFLTVEVNVNGLPFSRRISLTVDP